MMQLQLQLLPLLCPTYVNVLWACIRLWAVGWAQQPLLLLLLLLNPMSAMPGPAYV